ncbi:hypothetical protein UFOVP28_8 [uncultured Caudovirales phage]|uniref:Uncharacterized protein n=1 Tax=uncultured Caudovirales phage TaxID=2100421 RepID=A0A6J5KMU3_9CAUD|nr:hypothetical protein UFOVP28_8 [uncultured Caudovirales phage]
MTPRRKQRLAEIYHELREIEFQRIAEREPYPTTVLEGERTGRKLSPDHLQMAMALDGGERDLYVIGALTPCEIDMGRIDNDHPAVGELIAMGAIGTSGEAYLSTGDCLPVFLELDGHARWLTAEQALQAANMLMRAYMWSLVGGERDFIATVEARILSRENKNEPPRL